MYGKNSYYYTSLSRKNKCNKNDYHLPLITRVPKFNIIDFIILKNL